MDEMRYQLDLLTAINQRLGGQEKMYRLVCESSVSAFLYFSFENNKVQCLGNWDKYFDFEITQLKDIEKLYDIIDEQDIDKFRNNLFLEKREIVQETIECRLKNKNTWYQFDSKVIYDDNGKPTDKIVAVSDISTFKSQTEELVHMAYYDMMTGLFNRNYFVMKLGGFVRKAEEEENTTVSVMFIDIDDFKKINDGMGMVIGESLLQTLGLILKEFEEENVIVSHFTSDMFCIAIYDPCGARSVEQICKALKEKIRPGIILPDGKKILITVSIGVAEYPEATTNALELINCAEIVMFKAKASGKSAVKYFDTPIVNEFLQNVEIENKLKTAVFDKEFEMFFQPQFFAENKKLRGVEALLRWFGDDGKTAVSPSIFVPIAERNGMITTLGKWVIEESMKNFAEWKMQYDYPMIVSINISAIQYKQSDFVNHLVRVMEQYDIAAEEVELEITETVLIEDFEEVIRKLHMLRDYGIKISLDDFGTGFSSLSYLKGMPIDTLKIDKTFVDTILTDGSTQIITESIIHMVKQLGYETIAEGVEEKEQYEYLKGIGCDIIQGYYLGKPMSSGGIKELLSEIS